MRVAALLCIWTTLHPLLYNLHPLSRRVYKYRSRYSEDFKNTSWSSQNHKQASCRNVYQYSIYAAEDARRRMKEEKQGSLDAVQVQNSQNKKVTTVKSCETFNVGTNISAMSYLPPLYVLPSYARTQNSRH